MRRAILATLILIGPVFLVIGEPTLAMTGGPDSYGYIWVDSRSPSPTVAFSWIDIISGGTRLTLPDDGCTFEVSLGFQFRFYGTITDYVFICSNGFITFAVPDSFYPDPPIPSTTAPNNRVVGLGMDLNPAASGSGGVYFRSFPGATPKSFVVTWNGVYKWGTTRPETFQIILEQNETSKDGRILVQYNALNDASGALVGIENRTGTSGLSYPSALSNSLAVAFLPPSDAGLPPDILRVAATTLAPPSVEQGAANVPLIRLSPSTASNSIDIISIRVRLSGLGAGPEDVARARLWLDDGDGMFLPGNDSVLASGAFSGSPPAADLRPLVPLRVTTTIRPVLFVSYDITPTAGAGDWIGARLPDASFVSVAFPDVVAAFDFPIETYSANVRTRIDSSRDTLSLTSFSALLPAAVAQWDTDVPALGLSLSADKNSVDLAGLNVSLGGNVSAQDIWLVKAVRDLDVDGSYTPGTDVVLAVVPPTGAPPYADIRFPLSVAASSPERLLLLIDVRPDASPGRVVNLTLEATGVQLPPGSVDVVSASAFPAMSEPRGIGPGTRPSLRLPWVDFAPQADGVWQENEYLVGPDNTAALDRPAGNRVPGFLTAENSGTALYIAVDAAFDIGLDPGDGLALGFDTDLDGLRTDGADDVFVLNATGAGHYRFNASAGGWTLVQDCTPATVPSCATGTGVTPFRKVPHRFYEVSIPLAEIAAVPGGTVHLAVAAAPYFGLADGGNRSTWPLVFGPAMPSLAHFGALLLAPGPQPNRPPVLDWTAEPGYEADGLEPQTGLPNATFEWRIEYSDPDNDPPTWGQPQLRLFRDGFEFVPSPLTLSAAVPWDLDYRDGKVYFGIVWNLPCGGNYTYWFEARDARGLPANVTPTLDGPQVICPDLPPTLAGEGVSPFVGTAGQTVFTYRVAYSDPEGHPPVFIEGFVRRDGVLVGPLALVNTSWVGAPGDFAAGAWYTGSMVLTEPGINYTFQFRASDGNSTVETASILGPYVLPPPPDVLSVVGVDVAPLIVDAGTKMVPLLGLSLLTVTDVNVTAIRVDRIGTAGDDNVQAILLYLDTDASRSVTAPDVLLGVRQPLFGSATFPVSLRIVFATHLLFLVNLTRPGTPDGTVGLEVRDASYLTVGPGDLVDSFAPYRSTNALVNVPPNPTDPTVDGYPAATPQIQHILSGAPALGWRYADPNSGDVTQVAFNASVFATDPQPTLLWSRNESGALSSVLYAGPGLPDGVAHVFTITVFDGRLWSAPVNVPFRLNTPPTAPDLLAPTDGSGGIDPDVTLLWNPVADAEGDLITYTYWISDNPGFSPALSGKVVAPGAALTLSAGTTYYWKVGASDSFEFVGNATVWTFTTSGGGSGPTLGEVRGRVVNGTTPLADALVELLSSDQLVAAALTGPNGTFAFHGLDFGSYTVRASAFRFRPMLRAATPSVSAPIVDLGDVALTLYGPPDGGDTTPPSLTPTVLLGLLVAAMALSLLALVALVRRRPSGDESRRAADEASEHRTQGMPSEFLCPVCGRNVAAEATRCECGAEFETAARGETQD